MRMGIVTELGMGMGRNGIAWEWERKKPFPHISNVGQVLLNVCYCDITFLVRYMIIRLFS